MPAPSERRWFNSQRLARNELCSSVLHASVLSITLRPHSMNNPYSFISISAIAHINASVVQDSGFELSSFDILASDHHSLHQRDSIAKSTDDTYLIVPA